MRCMFATWSVQSFTNSVRHQGSNNSVEMLVPCTQTLKTFLVQERNNSGMVAGIDPGYVQPALQRLVSLQ